MVSRNARYRASNVPVSSILSLPKLLRRGPCSAFPRRRRSKVVRAPGFEPRPLGDGTAVRPRWFPIRRPGPGPGVRTLLRPPSRRVLPVLLPPVDSQVEQPIAVIRVFDSPGRRPVGLKDLGSLPQVANEVHPAYPAPNQKCFERALRRIPGHLLAHEVAVTGALRVGTLTKHGKCGVTRMEIGQLADLRGNPGAPLALLRRGMAGVPHEIVRDELPTTFERVEKRQRTVRANQRDARVHLHHREPAAGGGNEVTLMCVRLLPNPQPIELSLKPAPIDYLRNSKFISHDVLPASLPRRLRLEVSCLGAGTPFLFGIAPSGRRAFGPPRLEGRIAY